LYQHFLSAGAHYAKRVESWLRRRQLNPDVHRFFAFSTAALEALEYLNDRGISSVVDQVDPGRLDEEKLREECLKWPGWEQEPGSVPDAFYERSKREWELASLVLVNSPWSKKSLLREGVPESKVIVVPLVYESETDGPASVRQNPDRPLQVLWLGPVTLRKGIPYLFEAARLLPGVRFTVAGELKISDDAAATAPPNVAILGKVKRSQAMHLFAAADLFVLPTISDGFALTQLEAMSQGAPVIATPNCGEVVTEGQDGFIVPPGDGAAIAAAITRLDECRSLLTEMSRQAILKSRAFPLESYAATVDRLVDQYLETEGRSVSRGSS
jgi:glycosyltransferase involved in cell wall biosynthesis